MDKPEEPIFHNHNVQEYKYIHLEDEKLIMDHQSCTYHH